MAFAVLEIILYLPKLFKIRVIFVKFCKFFLWKQKISKICGETYIVHTQGQHQELWCGGRGGGGV